MNNKKVLFIVFVLFLLVDFSYSFLQFYYTPLDGDMAGGIIPSDGVKEIFKDPFGLAVIINGQRHPNPNRFFAHLFFRDYFQNIPLLFQNIINPIDSVYAASASIKLVLQLLITYLLSAVISNSKSVFNLKFILVAVLLTPLFQSYGYNGYMGIIDKSVTYTFFYILPLMLLLLFFSPFYTYVYDAEYKKLNKITKIWLLALVIILPFSGPLIPPLILITSLLVFVYFVKSHYKTHNNYYVFKSIPKDVLMFFIPICILSVYSLILGTYNSTYLTDVVPLSERYLRLPLGVYYQFTQKLGLPLLCILIAVNIGVIKKYFFDLKARSIITSLKWVGAFSIIYIFLLPLGGYRPYRPNVLRYDTIMPITICLLYIYGVSTLFLLENIKKRKNIYYIVIATFLMIFTNADKSKLNENECEKQALLKIANSEDQIVPLHDNCRVISWIPIRDFKQSQLNGELLKIWNITDGIKLYYNETEIQE